MQRTQQQHKSIEDGTSSIADTAGDGGKEDGGALRTAGDSAATAAAARSNGETPLDAALRKVGRRLVPLCFSIAVMNHLDRSNLAYAALSFNRDNGFDAATYSLGAALFFASFAVFQVPANLVMVRVGFRLWLALLLVGWGCVAVCFMFISSAWSFFLLRLLLGVFEAGAFPAMWYALSEFFPRKRVTKPYAYLTIGIMVANMVGAPLAAGLLAMDGVGGLRGWQWLFLLEGVPSVLLAGLVYLLMPSSIQTARFLTQPERDALAAEVARDHVPGPLASDLKGAMALLRAVASNGYLWAAFAAGCIISVASHTYLTFTPIIIANLLRGTAFTSQATVAAAAGAGAKSSLKPVALAVVPYALAAGASYLVAASAQRRDEQFLHVSSVLLVAGVVLAVFAPLARAAVAAGFLSLSLSLALAAAANGPAMVLVGRLCRGPGEPVVALPLFSSFTVLGGVVGPLLTGYLMGTPGGFTFVTVIMGALMFATGLIVLALRWWVSRGGGLPDGGAAARARSVISTTVPPGLPGGAVDGALVLARPHNNTQAAAAAAARQPGQDKPPNNSPA